MVNFAELKAKAEKAKDAGVTKVTNTRDRYSSVPSSKVNWDPNWKRAPPGTTGSSHGGSTSASMSRPPPSYSPPHHPMGSQPGLIASSGVPPTVPPVSRPTGSVDLRAHSPYTPPPPPTRAASAYPHSHDDTVDKIDWAHLSAEDKAAFFEWLDEFFSRYLGIEVGPKTGRGTASMSIAQSVHRIQDAVQGSPVSAYPVQVRVVVNVIYQPVINMATRPQV